MLVLISHSSGWLPDWVAPLSLGNVGVFSFFILSGFVIAEACDIFYPGRPVQFLLNRFIKIYPTYWASCLLAIVIYSWFQLPELNLSLNAILSNLSIFLAERLPPNEFRLNSMVWAVGIELRFYFIAALLTYSERCLDTYTRKLSRKLIYLVAVVFLSLYVYSFVNDFNIISTIKFAPFFLLGFIYHRWLKNKNLESVVIGILAFIASLHSYIFYNSAGGATDVQFTTSLFIFSTILFGYLATISGNSKALVGIDKKLGEMTYSIYLVHGPIIYAIKKNNFENHTSFQATVIVTIFISIIIHLLIEKQLIKLRDSIRLTKLQ